MFKLFKRKKAVISVPEIKEYLVKEFEKVEILTKTIHELEAELEKAEEIKHQYDAALVTLDKYKRRLEIADLSTQKVKKAHSSVFDHKTEKANADTCRNQKQCSFNSIV